MPRHLGRAPLSIFDDESGLPLLSDYRVLLLRSRSDGEATDVLAGYVVDTLRSMR